MRAPVSCPIEEFIYPPGGVQTMSEISQPASACASRTSKARPAKPVCTRTLVASPGTAASPTEHLDRVPDPNQRRRLENAHTFWLLAEQLYAQVKQRQSDLHFSAAQIFPFLLHWLQGQGLLPRLFWSPVLAENCHPCKEQMFSANTPFG
jgi:hypothetical protein